MIWDPTVWASGRSPGVASTYGAERGVARRWKLAIRRSRVHGGGRRSRAAASFQAIADSEPLNRGMAEQMLASPVVSTPAV